jgi:hypothetical protein
MKKTRVILLAVSVAMLAGCSTETVVLDPVGPVPLVASDADSDGILRVYTQKEEENDVGNQFPYYRRTDYKFYDSNGERREIVNGNNIGEYQATPRGIRLPPGVYTVKALAAVGLGEVVTIPVVIKAGRTTEVHLNGSWRPPSDTPANQLVETPAGLPMGWRVTPSDR